MHTLTNTRGCHVVLANCRKFKTKCTMLERAYMAKIFVPNFLKNLLSVSQVETQDTQTDRHKDKQTHRQTYRQTQVA